MKIHRTSNNRGFPVGGAVSLRAGIKGFFSVCSLCAALRSRAGRQRGLPRENHTHQQRDDAAGSGHQPRGRGEAHRLHQRRLPLRRHHPLWRAAQVSTEWIWTQPIQQPDILNFPPFNTHTKSILSSSSVSSFTLLNILWMLPFGRNFHFGGSADFTALFYLKQKQRERGENVEQSEKKNKTVKERMILLLLSEWRLEFLEIWDKSLV